MPILPMILVNGSDGIGTGACSWLGSTVFWSLFLLTHVVCADKKMEFVDYKL
jgi:hypothetical protein